MTKNSPENEARAIEVSGEDATEPQNTIVNTTVTPNELIISIHALARISYPQRLYQASTNGGVD